MALMSMKESTLDALHVIKEAYADAQTVTVVPPPHTVSTVSPGSST